MGIFSFVKKLFTNDITPEYSNENPEEEKKEKREVPVKKEKPPVPVVIGIDFGTCFTKVCYHIEEKEKIYNLVFKDSQKKEHKMIKSICYYRKDQNNKTIVLPARLADSLPAGNGLKEINSIKMKAATHKEGKLLTAEAISAFFISRVIRESVFEIEKEVKRKIIHTVNLGIPVDHYDSPVRHNFERILKAAYFFSEGYKEPDIEIKQLKKMYKEYQNNPESCQDLDLHVIPELQANIYSFTHSRGVSSGLYTLFDIGGGTMDCSCFMFQRPDRFSDENRLSIFSSQIKPLGMESLNDYAKKDPDYNKFKDLESVLRSDREVKESFINNPPLSEGEKRFDCHVHQAVAEVVMGSKLTGSYNVKEHLEKENLPVFICGGGKSIYKKWILDTWSVNRLRACGIPRLKVKKIGRNETFVPAGDFSDRDLGRFLVAYGLAQRKENLDKVIKFPSQIIHIMPEYKEYHHELSLRQLELYGEAEV